MRLFRQPRKGDLRGGPVDRIAQLSAQNLELRRQLHSAEKARDEALVRVEEAEAERNSCAARIENQRKEIAELRRQVDTRDRPPKELRTT